MTGSDVIAAKLRTGKPIKILEAVKIVPHGVQPGLVSVKLRSQMKVDPRRDDLAVKLVELRTSLKPEGPELAGGLKVAANSAAFGIYSQIDVRSLDSRSRLRVYSGETEYLTPSYGDLGAAFGVLLPRHRVTCHRRITSTLRHVRASRSGYGRTYRSDGHR